MGDDVVDLGGGQFQRGGPGQLQETLDDAVQPLQFAPDDAQAGAPCGGRTSGAKRARGLLPATGIAHPANSADCGFRGPAAGAGGPGGHVFPARATAPYPVPPLWLENDRSPPCNFSSPDESANRFLTITFPILIHPTESDWTQSQTPRQGCWARCLPVKFEAAMSTTPAETPQNLTAPSQSVQ